MKRLDTVMWLLIATTLLYFARALLVACATGRV